MEVMMLYELPAKVRYLRDLWGFMRHTMSPEEARLHLAKARSGREESFLKLAERGIYGNPRSPFRKLLLNAGIQFDDLRQMVEADGLDSALRQLYDAGVYLTFEEMFGRVPVKRGDLEFRVTRDDLDNPLLEAQYEVRSSGSSGNAGSRSFTDLTLIAHEAAYCSVAYQAYGMEGYEMVGWGPAPPSLWGFTAYMRMAKIGLAPTRWFTPTRIPGGLQGLRGRILLGVTAVAARLAGKSFAWPEYVPPDQAVLAAKLIAEMRANGKRVAMFGAASAVVRVCQAARDNALDISDTVFTVTGEPFTPAKAKVLANAGVRAINCYGASELAIAGFGCSHPASIDDMHLLTDKLHVQTRPKQVDAFGATVPALVYTTLLTNCRKILLNTESGDYGDVEDRECGCLFSEIGFKTHITGLHGYDKLTSGGVTFMGSELFTLAEEVLPARFGGNPTDYQFAEEEDENGLPRVTIVVSERVGEIDEAAVIEAVLLHLRGYFQRERGALMADEWRQGRTLRVARREPFAAGGRKVLPLHLMKAAVCSVPVPESQERQPAALS